MTSHEVFPPEFPATTSDLPAGVTGADIDRLSEDPRGVVPPDQCACGEYLDEVAGPGTDMICVECDLTDPKRCDCCGGWDEAKHGREYDTPDYTWWRCDACLYEYGLPPAARREMEDYAADVAYDAQVDAELLGVGR